VIGKTETQSAFEGQMDGGKYFPVNFGLLASTLKFSTVNGDNFVVGDVTIKTCPTNHPGGCTAYRFECGKCSIVVLSDHETGGADDARIATFIHAADYLIADTQYNSAEMNLRKGWGHGCIDQVVELATRSSVKQLFLYHHDPLHDDEFMDNFLLTAKQEAQALGSLSVFAATEGNEYHIRS
jgi:phosphoribosyl 1,2-cyclic phosphodiesterase